MEDCLNISQLTISIISNNRNSLLLCWSVEQNGQLCFNLLM